MKCPRCILIEPPDMVTSDFSLSVFTQDELVEILGLLDSLEGTSSYPVSLDLTDFW